MLAALLCLGVRHACLGGTGTGIDAAAHAADVDAQCCCEMGAEHNPPLKTFRRNHGIAEAAVQISRQYPFNPIIQDYVWYGNGPASAGVTNHFFNEHTARFDLELNGQGTYRRNMAHAALTRTQWEIAAQELLTSILVVRAYNTLLYRQAKYRLLEGVRI